MENKTINSYELVFSDGEILSVQAATLCEAIQAVGKKFHMLGLKFFSVNGGDSIEITIPIDPSCPCFQSRSACIPCTCTLREAEQQAA